MSLITHQFKFSFLEAAGIATLRIGELDRLTVLSPYGVMPSPGSGVRRRKVGMVRNSSNLPRLYLATEGTEESEWLPTKTSVVRGPE
jgi:hypothetical protein